MGGQNDTAATASTGGAMRPLRAFISYASEDDAHRIALEKYLRLFQRQGLLDTWSDRKILPGGNWGEEIDEALERADLILALVSVDFLASDYCYNVEMERALARHGSGEARLVPIIVRVCEWQTSPLGKLQALPERARPVAAWPDPDAAWTSVAEGLRRIADSLAAAHPVATPRTGGAPDPRRYLATLQAEHAYVEIRGMGAQVSERLPLRQVYTRLQAAVPELHTRAARPGKGEGLRPGEGLRDDRHRELRDLLADHPHAVLVGDPGSGKTTFLRYVAQHLAAAHLGDGAALARIGLRGDPPFPIVVRLERLAHFLAEHPHTSCPHDAPEHFYRYLDFQLNGHPYGLPDDYLRRRVLAGGCFLLLDGLDEVPGEGMRERLAALVTQVILQGSAVGNRHLVTSRTRAYRRKVQLTGDVATFHLAPLGPAQVEQFCDGWCRALFRVAADEVATPAAEQAAAYHAELVAAIDANPSGATFSASPLMLTVLAVVHWNRKKLPEQRAELYDAAVDYLVESRRALTDHPTPLRRECLQAVAMAMFEDGEGVQRSLGRPEAAAAVMPVLGVSKDAAIAFLEGEELLSGVLVSRTEGEVEFWHLTFQEYLAALELSQDEGWWSRLAPHLHDDRWSEVVLLLAGCRRHQGGLRAARRMIEQILSTGTDRVSRARAVGLVGRILRDIAPYGGDPGEGTAWRTMLADTLAIFAPDGEPVDEATRVEVGEALGQAGDPRLVDEAANRVFVPGGRFWMGAQSKKPKKPGYDPEARDNEAPVHEVTVSQLVVAVDQMIGDNEAPVHEVTVSDFSVGRYPVTVQEYRRFVEAGDTGYLDPRRWDPLGWAWREREQREHPNGWREQLTHPNRPVTSVSWYEADAYCRWVGGRLPIEAEWEWLARGPEGHRYPWGDAPPTERHANFENRDGSPTPVGIYPADADAVRDLAGNVWEWCGDWFGLYGEPHQQDPCGPKAGKARVLRGGSFLGVAHPLRAAFRGSFHPERGLDDVGFRVVWSSPRGEE